MRMKTIKSSFGAALAVFALLAMSQPAYSKAEFYEYWFDGTFYEDCVGEEVYFYVDVSETVTPNNRLLNLLRTQRGYAVGLTTGRQWGLNAFNQFQIHFLPGGVNFGTVDRNVFIAKGPDFGNLIMQFTSNVIIINGEVKQAGNSYTFSCAGN